MEARELTVPKTTQAPLLDGKADEPLWAKAAEITNFVLIHPDTPAASRPTRARMLYGDAGLYLAVECTEPEITRLEPSKEDGAAVFTRENVELFLSVPGESFYHQLAFTPDGARFNSHGPTRPPIATGNWKVATHRGEGSWSAELFLPWEHFGAGPLKEGWRFNMARTSTLPTREGSIWNYLPENDPEGLRYHQPRNFATLQLQGAPEKAPEIIELISETFDYADGKTEALAWQLSSFEGGSVTLDTNQYHRGEHPDAPAGASLRFTRNEAASGAAARFSFGTIPPASAGRVEIRCAAMTTSNDALFYPIVIGDWCARVGFGAGNQIFYTRRSASGEEESVEVGPSEPLQWHHFRVVVSIPKNSYDFYLDDKLIEADIPLVKPVHGWNHYLASTGGGAGGEVEQVHFLDDVRMTLYPAGAVAPIATRSATPATPPAIAEASLRAFSKPIVYGEFESIVKNEFPLGVTFSNGGEMTNRRWRWMGPRSSGRLDAMSPWQSYRDLKLTLPERGEYEIAIEFVNMKVWGGGVAQPGLGISAGETQETLSPRFSDAPRQWTTWKTLQLEGQPLTLSKPKGRSIGITGLRLTPAAGGEPILYQGERLVELLRSHNQIFEEGNPEDAVAFLKEHLPTLKALNVDTLHYHGPSSPEAMNATLDQLHENGMRAILSINWFTGDTAALLEMDESEAIEEVKRRFSPVVNKIKGHPALLGYGMIDEPFVEQIPEYRLIYEGLRQLDPDHPAVAWLCRASWNNDAASRRGIDNMKKWVEGVKEEQLFNDLYPIRYPEEESLNHLKHYALSLEDDQRQAGGRPLWIMAQAIDYANVLRHPTPAEIRAQAYLSFAHGATGLIYYNYNAPDTSLLDGDGKPNERTRELGKVFAEIAPLRALLLASRRVKLDASSPDDFAIQGFVHHDGRQLLVIASKDVRSKRTLHLTLPASRVTDLRTNEALVVNEGKLTLELEPGDGRILELHP